MIEKRLRGSGRSGLIAALAMVVALLPAAAGAEEGSDPGEPIAPEERSVVTLVVPDQQTLVAVVDGGYDLDHDIEAAGDGYAVTGIVTDTEAAQLEALGVEIDTIATPAEAAAAHEELLAERNEILDTKSTAAFDVGVEQVDTVVIARADFFTDGDDLVISVEAKSSDGQDAELTMEWDAGPGTEIGDGGLEEMNDFVDAGQYLYHREQQDVDVEPVRVRVTSDLGGVAEAEFEEWLPTDFPPRAHRYFDGFVDSYMDPYELTAAIEDLHAEFPELTDIIELPYQTNGYRRNAQALIGTTTSNAVGVDSHAWGHEGGNDLSIAFVDPGEAESDLAVDVDGDEIEVSLGTDAEGVTVSTAAEVVAAINGDDDAGDLILAYTYRGNDGDGTALTGEEDLSDNLDAPDHVERAPFQVKMLRIGKHRDGSKTGVLTYSQEHAREWQTPVIQIETASRMLHNYATDHKTRQLVDNLDLFIVPVVNPDGALYSFYDANFQRKNMTRHCDVDEAYDVFGAGSWGVDNNRNYTAYSGVDGYSGASTSCTSGTYRGPAELSEPESANMHWIPAAYPNIDFAMNVHSSGNYFMWSPGSYAMPGRITAPRPSFGTEEYFWEASKEILTEIKQHRGLSVTPRRTGPIADVLYSAAGNSGDMMYYDYGLYAWNFEVGTSFQPSFAGGAGSEAWNQMMEFSNGLVELYDVALTWTRDRYAPTSWINEDVSEPSDGPVGITFGFSEPVDIYYTTDGSNPTTDSAQYEAAGIREGGETLWFDETTTIKWFSVDQSGNVEGKYHPSRDNANTATIVIEP